MTAHLWRWTRRCESDHVSNVLAAFWRHGHTDLGTFEAYLLGETRVRKVVAVALLLEIEYKGHFNPRLPSHIAM